MDRATATTTVAAAGAALTDAGRTAPDAAVAACPGWTVATVVKHVGLVHTWVTSMLRSGGGEPATFPKAPEGLAAVDLPDWADARRGELLDAFGALDPDRPVWAFGAVLPARFWWRRQAVETGIHAWDATDAAGTPWTMPADAAAEGVEEVLDWGLVRAWAHRPPDWGRGRTVHLHRTDGEGEWLLTIDDPPVVARGHAKGDLAVRGSAADLLLWAWNRKANVELLGDQTLAGAWAEHVKV